MKIKIYSVAEKKPPINELLLKYEIIENVILDVQPVVAAVSQVSQDEIEFQSNGVSHELVWVSYIAEDMMLDDLWSFAQTMPGE